MAAFNVDITGSKSNGSIGNGNTNGSVGNANSNNNRGTIANSNNNHDTVVNGNGNTVHENYGTVQNMFVHNTGGKRSGSVGNGNSNHGSMGNNSGSIGNDSHNNSGTIGNAYHHNYATVQNKFIVLNICPRSGADADGGDGDQNQARGAARMVAWILGVIGVATSSIATGATAYNYKYNRPRRVVNHGRELAYLIGIVVVFLAGLAEVGAAFWVSVDNRNRYGASRKIMCAAIVGLVVAVGLGCFAIVLKN